MQCFWLKNYQKMYNIKKHEMRDFQRTILYAIEMCSDIYWINLNSSNVDAVFLGNLFDVLISRKIKKYGPEILDIENIGIKEEGIELICKYLASNMTDTKWLAIGEFFGNGWQITHELAHKLCLVFERNNHRILRMNVKLHHQYEHQIEAKLKQNKKHYLEERKSKLSKSKKKSNDWNQYSTKTLLRF